MKIISLKLQNIRSYLDETIIFPNGSILLSGDIGSGKSTILFAIEFALFGMARGEGNALLRQGKHEGSVELTFAIDDKEYIVMRKLKRAASVTQDAGYIITDGVKKEGTAVELKSDILDILNYPKELLTKKNLVYRYTVYTPQESMKQILLDNKEFRIDTLRKVFGIDKYRLIRENCDLIAKELRDQVKILVAQTEQLPDKKLQVEHLQKEISAHDGRILEMQPKLVLAKQQFEEGQIAFIKMQQEVQALQIKKQQYSAVDNQLVGKTEMFTRQGLESEQLVEEEKKLQVELEGKEVIDVASQIEEKMKESQVLEGQRFTLVKHINEATVKKDQALQVQQKINTLAHCPTCEQNVSAEYKQKIQDREGVIIIDQDKNITKFQADQQALMAQVEGKHKEMELLRVQEKEVTLLQHKKQQLENIKLKKEQLVVRREQIKQEIGALNTQKLALQKELKLHKDSEEEFKVLQVKVDGLRQVYHQQELQVASAQKEKEGVERMIAVIREDVVKMESYLVQIDASREKEEWLRKMFVNLMSQIEKHVMAKLYHEFNALFQDWFNVLIEDQALTVALDDEFGVEITQNGYQVSLEHMSGGEKTSCALAYRLSLNQIINDLIGEVKTKDVLILDEPTDGFSSEQLDKIRDVLNELALEQIIIVSHERKIESFVDHVIQVRKEEHVSSVS
jgi:exonuclease SbcC